MGVCSTKHRSGSFFVCGSNSSKRSRKYQSQGLQVKSLPCKYCNSFIGMSYYDDHVATCSFQTTGREEILMICTYCNSSFPYEVFENHEKTCEENLNNVMIPCKYCKKDFNAFSVIPHMDTCQLNPVNAPKPCEFLCAMRIDPKEYGAHKELCPFNPVNLKFPCKYCKKLIARKHLLQHQTACEKEQKALEEKKLEKQCCICLEEIADYKTAKFLACMHKFHSHCIEDWSKKQKSCPTCWTEFSE